MSASAHDDVGGSDQDCKSGHSARFRHRYIDRLVAERSLPPKERLVGVGLAQFLNTTTGQLNPSFETLAKATGTSVRSAKRHVQTLIEAGWLKKRSRRGRVSNEYELVIPTVPSGWHG